MAGRFRGRCCLGIWDRSFTGQCVGAGTRSALAGFVAREEQGGGYFSGCPWIGRYRRESPHCEWEDKYRCATINKMRLMKKGIFVLAFLMPLGLMAGEFDGIRALVKRRVPWLEGHLLFRKIDAVSGGDACTLSSADGKVVIGASNPNAAAEGLNWYLKYFCHRSISHMGDNLAPVYPLPVVRDPVAIHATAQYRHALNYCTYNYSMSFYTWKDWEHELDWMAMNGVNLMLVANGEEAVWQRVLRRLGYTDKEIQA